MALFLTVFTARTGERRVERVGAETRQQAITAVRARYGARGDVSAVKIASTPRTQPTVPSVLSRYFPGQ